MTSPAIYALFAVCGVCALGTRAERWAWPDETRAAAPHHTDTEETARELPAPGGVRARCRCADRAACPTPPLQHQKDLCAQGLGLCCEPHGADHLSQNLDDKQYQRRLMENAMAELKQLTDETGVGAVLVGPGGPTGILGPNERPTFVGPGRPTGVVGAGNQRLLVGPGGPTGIIGPGGNSVLIGPGGPTGIIGPNRSPVLVGPDGPTGIVGPDGNTRIERPVLIGPGGPTGIIGLDERRVLVGPGGPTGVIGPSGRPVLVGPGGPTGNIGPPFRRFGKNRNRS